MEREKIARLKLFSHECLMKDSPRGASNVRRVTGVNCSKANADLALK